MQKSKYETPQVKVHAVAMDAGLLAGSNEITGGGDNTDRDVNTSKGSAFEADDDVASPSKNCWD